jgi:hypothetical protein
MMVGGAAEEVEAGVQVQGVERRGDWGCDDDGYAGTGTAGCAPVTMMGVVTGLPHTVFLARLDDNGDFRVSVLVWSKMEVYPSWPVIFFYHSMHLSWH